ncbi:pyridoxamine 5'-phosphate oxidase family protein [Rhodococcus sp. SMB37]|uniref:pyridoxamine 5'-phosphate oxidase family protein n=1 Tax=Rhodococcus sp. SMB37 TaxID=2512213 RepID=UPI0010511C1E|nr:pyridoxamine 5'-phosphate oxidase family protein [Rhodococcus sp. SMB37]
MKQQRRGRRIAMLPEEVDAFLNEERTCRVATSGPAGPHLSALWFVWDGSALWLNSVVKSQRWTDLERNPQGAVLIDAGHEFNELRGVEIRGRFDVVGDVPRSGAPDPELAAPEQLFARKYTGRDEMHFDGRHAWLRLTPQKITSWDFRKM